ncbi:hypothetical protein ASH01_11540 [Terrabacter sp. Soil811]|uniref:McrB family protein n=1 Tax=Terrabacter sp. Soil811 TaxID=1736419 RepID=UPI0006F3EF12|nr:AAA family ATPase [Terrabacter sp. Soil811]KRF44618.1 hypothetical protein ASH01_11540 [Terrabacter sp. Soil811]
MTRRPVDAVFFWPMTKDSVFKPVYGRAPKDTKAGGNRASYTKDYLQPTQTMSRALEAVLGVVPASGTLPLEWRWPGGLDSDGSLRHHDVGGVRLDLDWSTTTGAPRPWRLTPHPSSSTVEAVAGDPSRLSIDDADAELEQIRSNGERPWLLAVHRRDEGAVLHARVVLENPATGHEYASWERIPAKVRREMSSLAGNQVMGVTTFEETGSGMRAEAIVHRVLKALKDNPNVLLVGPPGCGKTVALEDLRAAYESGTAEVTFDDASLHGGFSEVATAFDGQSRVRSLVFHPSYAYEDFVVGLLPEPVTDAGGNRIGGVTVKPRVGPLLELARFASKPNCRALLIADEFNRGAAAAIFGDTLALLDGDKRRTPGETNGSTIDTPFFHLGPQTADGDALEPQTALPQTLHIIAAMNSADRSVAPLDAALRRRFAIIYVGPDYGLLRERLALPADFVLGQPSTWSSPEHVKALAVAILQALNERIEVVLGRDFLLGHSVMWDVAGDTVEAALRSLAAALDNSVLGTLALSFVDNDAALAAILNVPGSDTETTGPQAATWHQPSESVRQVAAPRLRLAEFQALPFEELVPVLASLLD